jgi:hypothetical protein
LRFRPLRRSSEQPKNKHLPHPSPPRSSSLPS